MVNVSLSSFIDTSWFSGSVIKEGEGVETNPSSPSVTEILKRPMVLGLNSKTYLEKKFPKLLNNSRL